MAPQRNPIQELKEAKQIARDHGCFIVENPAASSSIAAPRPATSISAPVAHPLRCVHTCARSPIFTEAIMLTAQILPITDTTTVDELAQVAKANRMHLISDGSRVLVSPIVPAGFFKIAVKIKSARRAELEALPCAA